MVLTITPDGVRRPVAAAVLTFLLALSHKLLIKDRLTRAGRWAEKLDHMGHGPHRPDARRDRPGQHRPRSLSTGRAARNAAPGGRPVRLAGRCCRQRASQLVDLDTLLRESDFVVVCCALTEGTRHLINAERLALMKPTAYLINVARGPIVDQAALTEALQERRIAGAGLDVFEQEPIDPHDPLLALDNVILAPHALCWTDECFAGNGRSAIASILDVAAGRVPTNRRQSRRPRAPTFQREAAALRRRQA